MHAIFTFLRTYLVITYLIVLDDLLCKAGTTYFVYSEELFYSLKATYLIILIVLLYLLFFLLSFFIVSFYCFYLLYYLYYTLYIIGLHIINN